ncbi:ATP-dependent 6-phosphofructokinase [Fontisphaera persica]|uniref:6-phosphofructokinase n=1 Tax=Fontisphaera persica TaxID=2974023 RepID=UPI0024BFC29E|nr:ATP-dependent 6-phosphofructokinase [Fontisphaera persica]WCJ58924.1 ATP-dependent 6-phosphofructokinase [Fontisphaera persica]
MSIRIGILTGGGDCPGLNAVIRAVGKSATTRGWETLGFHNGFEGLLDNDYRVLNYKDMDGLLLRGGTILGTTNKGRFAVKTGHGETHRIPEAVLARTKENIHALGLRALVVVGGDGTLTIAQQLFEAGVPLVGVPKTIDNDLEATAFTFGFDSAVACATDALDRLHTTAESHNRVMVLEVMGRYAGWIAMHAGIAGGGDVILIPEIPFTYESICTKIAEREARGKHFTLVVVAEGARPKGGDFVTSGPQETNREARLGGIGAVVAAEIQKRTGKETRVCVLGHLQRGGGPTTFDRMICTQFGAMAVRLIAGEQYGYMAALRPPEVVAVPIREAIGRLRTIDPKGELVQTARDLGVSLGD